MYNFMDWLDRCQPTIELIGDVSLVVCLLFLSAYAFLPKKKGMMDKWDESVKDNFARGITKHENKPWVKR